MPSQPNRDRHRMSRQSRRRFLLGVGAGTAALAGCLGEDDETDDGSTATDPADDPEPLPEYADWLPADDSVFFAHATFESDVDTESTGQSVDESVDDPLVTFPADVGGSVVGLYLLSLAAADLSAVVDPETETASSADELVAVNEAVVLTGAFDMEELDERLTDETNPFAATYEQTDDINGFDHYTPTEVPEDLDDPPEVAVDETTAIVAPAQDRLEQVIATGAGDQPGLTDENDDAEWLLRETGTGDIAFGTIGPVPEDGFSLDEVTEFTEDGTQFEPATDEDVVASMEADLDTETVETRVALTADEISEDTETTVETTFGTAATERSIDIGEERIVAHGTYDAAEIGATADDAAASERGELTQEQARALVPLDALEYWYQPATGQQLPQLWVEVTEDTDAMGLRVEAESWAENEITMQDGTISARTSVPVQIEPDEDDEVTVFAVDDDEAVGQLDTVEPPTDELTEEAAREAVPEDALSFEYDPPGSQFGSLSVTVTDDTTADILVAQPSEAPRTFGDHAGSIDADGTVAAETTLETAVDPDGDEVVIFATVDGATGEVARWEGPE